MPTDDSKPKDTRFQPGNSMWRKRSRHGRRPIFPVGEESAQKLAEAVEDYFTELEGNPLQRAKLVKGKKGDHELAGEPVARVASIFGLCTFIGISHHAWNEWKRADHANFRADLVTVIREAETMIASYSTELASGGFANASIVARLLGLADRVDHSSEDGSMTPPPTEIVLRGVRAEKQEDE